MSASFEDFRRGDRIRFSTMRTAFLGPRMQKMAVLQVWRTGVVDLATPRALTVVCDMPNPIGRRAVIKRTEFATRNVTKMS